MGQIKTIILLLSIWLISFVEPSGWAMAHHLPERINYIILFLSIFFFSFYPKKRQKLTIGLFFFIIISFVVIPFIYSGTWQGASYVVAFLTVYIVSQGDINQKVIRYSALAIAGLGLGVLLIYVNGEVLSGWNDNAISMVGLFSFLYFSIFLIDKKGTKEFWFWNLITVWYLVLLLGTDCRSGMLFSILCVVGIVYSNKIKRALQKRWVAFLILNLPLIIALLTMLLSQTEYYQQLNEWSMREFDKPFTNKREELWGEGLLLLDLSDYVGTGKFLMNYHNSGIAALSVFGILGYICWIMYFNANTTQLRKYLNDDIVFGSLLAFYLIFIQQSFDLGFISEYPNLMPYMILGVGLGRIRQLTPAKRSYNDA